MPALVPLARVEDAEEQEGRDGPEQPPEGTEKPSRR